MPLPGVARELQSALSNYLIPRTNGVRYELAVDDPLPIAPLIIEDQRPILPLTSWKGRPLVSLAELKAALQEWMILQRDYVPLPVPPPARQAAS